MGFAMELFFLVPFILVTAFALFGCCGLGDQRWVPLVV
jgi:hypothetical protein